MKKLAVCFVLLVCICFSSKVSAITYYVSYSAGNDTYNGTSLAAPFKTITKAVAVANAGDIIYLRGELHVYAAKISISKSGTSANRISLLAYPGDAARPVIDFSAMAINSSNRGIDLSGNYWYMKGFDIYKAGDNGMHVNGSNNIFEFMSFYENADTGLQFDNGASYNQIINCDSYYNMDPGHGNADGFAVKLNVGTGNAFRGCRAWQNSDDGWDGLLTAGLGTNPATTYDSCWIFLNGYLKNMTASTGNGNGLKMGGNNELHDATVRNCLAVYNRVKGFDQNNNNGSMILYNCTGYKNGRNFGMNNNAPSAGEEMIIKNSISYQTVNADVFYSGSTRTHNSWQGFTVDATDFVSLDTAALRAPRNADGSLPNISLLKLAPGSDMIDGGVDVGLPYNGLKPDLGYAESNYAMPVQMTSFTGYVKDGYAQLSWKTSSETQNKGWDVERLVEGNATWQKIGFIEGKGTSNLLNEYHFTDLNTTGAAIIQYRLKQMDNDGRYAYSKSVTVRFRPVVNKLDIYPNPAVTTASVSFDLPSDSKVMICIYNQSGQLVNQLEPGILKKGQHRVQFNTSHFAAGQYSVRLITAEKIVTGNFIKGH